MMKVLYTVKEAAEATGISQEALLAAIKGKTRTSGKPSTVVLPRLRARQATGEAYRITHADLTAWVDQLPDHE